MASIQLHEYAHAVVAVLLTGAATVSGAMADHPPTTDANLALIAMAGPAFSLVLGALLHAIGHPTVVTVGFVVVLVVVLAPGLLGIQLGS